MTRPHPGIQVERFTLEQGEIFMSDQPAAVTTLLGSCVSACMHDPVTKRGAICHAMLPNAPVVLHKGPFRYVDEAILFILERYRRMEIPPERLLIKLFGGADVLPRASTVYESIGRQNTMAAIETLGWQGLRATVRETGGDRGRKLVFMPHTGDVFVRRLDPVMSRRVAEEQETSP